MAAVEYFLNGGGSSDDSDSTKPAPVVVVPASLKFCNGPCQRHLAAHRFSQHQLMKTATDKRRCTECIAGAEESRKINRVAEAEALRAGKAAERAAASAARAEQLRAQSTRGAAVAKLAALRAARAALACSQRAPRAADLSIAEHALYMDLLEQRRGCCDPQDSAVRMIQKTCNNEALLSAVRGKPRPGPSFDADLQLCKGWGPFNTTQGFAQNHVRPRIAAHWPALQLEAHARGAWPPPSHIKFDEIKEADSAIAAAQLETRNAPAAQ